MDSQKNVLIDTSFNFYSDATGPDPDTSSPTLKKYHKLLWNKLLPNGKIFTLSDDATKTYLSYQSVKSVINLSSDSISNSLRKKKQLSEILKDLSSEVENFRNIGSTIGGYILFPSKKIDGKMTINGARGFDYRIADRFDLTLECIRLHYMDMENPLNQVLTQNASFFELFENFAGYVNFFFLQDLVTDNYDSVRFFTTFKHLFATSPLPEGKDEYLEYMKGSTSFTINRNERIKQWAQSNLA